MDFANYWFSSGSNNPGPDPGFIGNSLRFRGAQQLSRTFGSGGDRQRMTISFWHKNSNNTSQRSGFMAVGGQGTGNVAWGLYGQAQSIQANGQFYLDRNAINGYGTNGNYRDPSAWYHVVLRVDTTQSSATNRFRMYVNGVQDGGSSLNYSINDTFAWNGNFEHRIGQYYTNTSEYLRGYLAEYHFVDGQSLAPTAFAEANADGVWTPITYTNGWGTTGFYLDFSDPADIGADRSGNGNNWTPTNFELTNTASINYDWTEDSPTNNYSTFNPLSDTTPGNSVSANLRFENSSQSAYGGRKNTLKVPTTGTFYFEIHPTVGRFDNQTFNYYLRTDSGQVYRWYYGSGTSHISYNGNNRKSPGNTSSSNVEALKIVDGVVSFWRNNSVQYTFPEVMTAQGIFDIGTSWENKINVNYGQLPNRYTNHGDSNISTARVGDVAITNPSDHFRVILDTGANILTNAQATFPNGLWWIKDRANQNQHQLVDSVRGGNLALQTPTGAVQTAYVAPAGNSVAWCWRAGDSTVTNNDGTIETQVSVNQEAGFSIITYSGTGAFTNQNIGHGLGRAPSMCTISYTDGSAAGGVSQWYTYHVGMGDNRYMRLNGSGGSSSSSGASQGGPDFVTDTVIQFRKGTSSIANVNSSNLDYVCYAWAEIPGYSAFGEYTANNNNDGVFVYTGFRPAWVLIKRQSSGDWGIWDHRRNTYNPCDWWLISNGDHQERNASPNARIDFLSNGFKLRDNATMFNSSGDYIYAAFAEHPLGGGNVSPSPAR